MQGTCAALGRLHLKPKRAVVRSFTVRLARPLRWVWELATTQLEATRLTLAPRKQCARRPGMQQATSLASTAPALVTEPCVCVRVVCLATRAVCHHPFAVVLVPLATTVRRGLSITRLASVVEWTRIVLVASGHHLVSRLVPIHSQSWSRV